MRVAVCDDDKNIIDELKETIYSYANSHRLEVVIEDFNCGEALLSSKYLYDMIFLDYEMGELNGLDTAKILRERNLTCSIIFLTNFPHFVYESFTVNAFRFMEKPVDAEKIYEAFDGYFKMYGNDYRILLNYKHEKLTIETKDIVFLEADNKHCIIHMRDKSSTKCGATMAKVSELLPRNHFYKVNRAFIVNFNFIEKYNSEMIFFKNGEGVRISKGYLAAFKNAYRNYSELQNPRNRKDTLISS